MRSLKSMDLWSHQVSAVETARWLQRDQTLPSLRRVWLIETPTTHPHMHTVSEKQHTEDGWNGTDGKSTHGGDEQQAFQLHQCHSCRACQENRGSEVGVWEAYQDQYIMYTCTKKDFSLLARPDQLQRKGTHTKLATLKRSAPNGVCAMWSWSTSPWRSSSENDPPIVLPAGHCLRR